ncbi:hypothetical protein [Halogranum rubrum]|uniref:hypothetical protein n=1 Tax=Halogranum rubrum TaxID=553466 RepID=UPI000B7CA705|nr:hypothetical protein [Halogranum rubrum]
MTTAVSEALLDGARYIRALPFAPEQPIGEIESVVRDATVVRPFSPVVVGRYVSLCSLVALGGVVRRVDSGST